MKKKMESSQCTPINYVMVSEIELIYKNKVKASERPYVKGSKEVYDIFLKCWHEDKIEYVEQFKIMLLNTANKILGIYEVSTGGISGTVADPRVIFTAALKAGATAIILAHNHPSGYLQPSGQDIHLTAKIKSAGEFLDIRVLDHLIISPEGYYSFADEGKL